MAKKQHGTPVCSMSEETVNRFRKVFNLGIDDFDTYCKVTDQILVSIRKMKFYHELFLKAEEKEKTVPSIQYHGETVAFLALLRQLEMLGLMSEKDKLYSIRVADNWVLHGMEP